MTALMRLMPATLVLAGGLLGDVARGATIAADGKVHDLTTAAFNKAVKEHPLLFVMFHAPWCGHCKKFAPEWERLAALSESAGVPIAKVDAIAEQRLAEKLAVEGFPTLKLFRGSLKVVADYKGPREPPKMLEWLNIWLGDGLVESVNPSAAAIRAWAGKKRLALLGVRSGQATPDASMGKVLEDATFMLNSQKPGSEVLVGEMEANSVVYRELVRADQSPQPPCVVLFREFEFEEKRLVYAGKTAGVWESGAFMDWFHKVRLPALIPASPDTEKDFLQNIEPGHGLVILFDADGAAAKELHKVAIEFKNEKRLKWVHAEKKNNFSEGLAKSVGVEDFPEIAIWQFGENEDEDKVFRISQQGQRVKDGFSSAAARDFVESWQSGKLTADKDPILAVTSDTFEQYVMDAGRDVLVEFYAPWCGHCKALAPEYKNVGIHYADDNTIRIVKMDATKHSHKSATIKSYPTLKLYPRSDKKKPIDLEFKAARNKQHIIDFIEKHRRQGEKGPSENKAQAKSAGNSKSDKAMAGKAQSGSIGRGVWIFDDSMDQQNRGQELSQEMVASQGGYTLVTVGSLGVLIAPGDPATARAVRYFGTAAEASRYAQEIAASPTVVSVPPPSPAPVPDLSLGGFPCPNDPDLTSCKAWCAGVSPAGLKWKGAKGGKPCGDVKSEDQRHDQPTCTCYDKSYTVINAMCVSACQVPPPAPAKCSAGDATCSAPTGPVVAPPLGHGVSSSGTRYLLYDTKYGEGFNLQREVYPRAGWLVSELNKAIEARCGKKQGGPGCMLWSLVLPPWCSVVHWWSESSHRRWAEFFDIDVLKRAKIPVIEFADYKKLTGGNQVDLAVAYQTEKSKVKNHDLSGGFGEFDGWAAKLEDCTAEHREVPEYRITNKSSGKMNLLYAGKCDGGINTQQFRCAVFKSPFPTAPLNMLSSLDESIGSVLLKNYDYLLSPDNDELDKAGLRDSMLFAKEIRERADEFISSQLGGRPYIAAHCRRTDFLRVRKKTTPDASNIAAKLNALLKEQGMDQIFVATDAPNDLKKDLEAKVNGTVHFFTPSKPFDHPGKQTCAEMWIAARADFFIGTIESRVTMHIQLERGFLGKPRATSEQEFCKTFENEKGVVKPCGSHAYRHPAGKGRYRGAYL